MSFALSADDPDARRIERVVAGRANVVYWGDESALVKQIEELAPDLVTTFVEELLAVTSDAARAAGRMAHAAVTVSALRGKVRQRELLARAALPVPWFRGVDRDNIPAAIRAAPPGDLVLKPAEGAGSRHTYRTHGGKHPETGVFAALPEIDYIIEEELRGAASSHRSVGDYGSVELISVDGRHSPLAVVGRFPLVEPFRERGGFHPSAWSTEEQAEMSNLASRALDALDVRDGLSHVEIKHTPEGPRVIEVNGRLGGNVADLLHRSARFDILREWLTQALPLAGDAHVGQPQPMQADKLCYRWCLYAEYPLTGVLSDIIGLADVRQLPHVDRVALLRRRGEMIDWRDGTASAVAMVDGTVEDFYQLDHAVQQLADTARVVLDPVHSPSDGSEP
ncbi:ATP-grasp domain-containing protein [Kribbella sp. NBC_00709]|uniref:ATP-grasp domain-containing protein n=1 Tax=Kribbella sp. NBC_00709 TaxID=2975972 RepID=UPI002E297ED1|nr:ATP-grasp domain-containing protein [Kribbella sp. NBC_00709]